MAVLAMRVPFTMAVQTVALCTDHGCTYYVAVYLLELWPSSCKPYAFQVYLRSIARKHVQGEVTAADIEKDVKRQFGIDLTGKLTELQEPMDKSRVCTQPRLPSFHLSRTKAHACCTFAVYSYAHFLR